MPVCIPDGLPAAKKLIEEGIFVMPQTRAAHQDIRPLRICILNLMPTKEVTEMQLLRLVGNSPIQVDVTLLRTASYASKNTAAEYLATFYKTYDDVKDELFDGLIITGAPVEHMDFESVEYWDELQQIMTWADTHTYSMFFICWAAQAALYHFYNIKKQPIDRKIFGIFEHNTLEPKHPLLRGFDDVFYAPHSRHTTVTEEDIRACADLELLAVSPEAGVYIVANKQQDKFFVTGHSEYDPETLELEYKRDVARGLPIEVPQNYYPNDDPTQPPVVRWRSHANMLFTNWLNYFVYQETPFNISDVAKKV